jgi:hypothetical protein
VTSRDPRWRFSKLELYQRAIPMLRDYADILDKRGDDHWAANARTLADHMQAKLAKARRRASDG